VLESAYRKCKANGGAAGVDRQTFDGIEKYGQKKWLGELAAELKDKSYRPAPVRRVWIDKANGEKRPLGVPTIKDRVFDGDRVLTHQDFLDYQTKYPLLLSYAERIGIAAQPGEKVVQKIGQS